MTAANETDLLVVGAGPAGLCAAIEAARHGVRTTLVDENPRPGGQLFKQIHKFFGSHRHRAGVRGFRIGEELLSEIERLGIRVLLDTVAFGFHDDSTVGLYRQGRILPVRARRTVLATGALEKPLTFRGWTLPGVMGAGAVQTMVNLHGVLPGTRVLMVGSGNVGLIVAYQLIQAGASVVAVVEALPAISGWHVHAAKIRRLGVPILLSHTVLEARGRESVEEAVIAPIDEHCRIDGQSERRLDVDLVCIAVGLRPLSELAELARCRLEFVAPLGGFLPLHDETMKSSRPEVYVAGDLAGIEEASTAMEEGKLAGLSVAHSLGKLDRQEYTALAEELIDNLAELRLGSFGDARKRCKDEIVARYRSVCAGAEAAPSVPTPGSRDRSPHPGREVTRGQS
jgi:NADPH-dependent 2,4-dienoyl-CoA reductase/sulfur reductase-like enzyme